MSHYKVDGYCLNSLHPSLSLLIPSKGMSTLFSKSLDPTSLSYWKNLHTCILWYSKLAIGKTWKTHENRVSFCGQIMYDAFQCPIYHCRLWLHQRHPKITESHMFQTRALQYKHNKQIYLRKQTGCLVIEVMSPSDQQTLTLRLSIRWTTPKYHFTMTLQNAIPLPNPRSGSV